MNRKDLLQRHKELQAAIQKREEENVLKRLTFLPSQQKVIDAYHDPSVHITIFTGPNQVGRPTPCAPTSRRTSRDTSPGTVDLANTSHLSEPPSFSETTTTTHGTCG